MVHAEPHLGGTSRASEKRAMSVKVGAAIAVATGAAAAVGIAVLLERRRRRLHKETTVSQILVSAEPTVVERAEAATRTPLRRDASFDVHIEPPSSLAATPEVKAKKLPDDATTADASRRAEASAPSPVAPLTFDEMGGRELQSEVWRKNQERIKAQKQRELARAHRRLEEVQKRIEAQQAAGVETLAERSKRILDEARAREAAAPPPPPVEEAAPEAAAARPPPPGATEATVAAELARWPAPPVGAVTALQPHAWPVYHDHFDWLDEITSKYKFADAGETLRHLLFVANGEAPPVKKLIFLSVRCLHCHAGAGSAGDGIPKKPKPMAVFGFQSLWLEAVMKRSGHPTIEKTVRIVVDYYRKVTSDAPGVEAELFWRRRGGR